MQLDRLLLGFRYHKQERSTGNPNQQFHMKQMQHHSSVLIVPIVQRICKLEEYGKSLVPYDTKTLKAKGASFSTQVNPTKSLILQEQQFHTLVCIGYPTLS